MALRALEDDDKGLIDGLVVPSRASSLKTVASSFASATIRRSIRLAAPSTIPCR